jgi:hypothetical protein
MPLVRVEEQVEHETERAPGPATEPRVAPVLALQRSAGNAAVARLLMRKRSAGTRMLQDARRREREKQDDGTGVDPSEWGDDDAEAPEVDESQFTLEPKEAEDTGYDADTDEPEAPQEPLAPMSVAPELAQEVGDPTAPMGIWNVQQRMRATGESPDDIRANAPRPQRVDPGPEISQRAPMTTADRRRVAKTVGKKAGKLPGPGQEANPGGYAAESIVRKRDLRERHERNVQQRAQNYASAQAGIGKPITEDVAAGKVTAEMKKRDADHQKMITADHAMAVYQRLRGLAVVQRDRLNAASPFVQSEVKVWAGRLNTVIAATDHADEKGTTKKTIDDATTAIDKAIAAENAYKDVRAKAERILALIRNAGPAFKGRLDKKSETVAEQYATGSPLPTGKPQQDAHRALNEAEQDVNKHAKDWDIAKRSHDKLAELKTKRANLGYIDATVDHAIAVSDGQDLALDFWSLQTSVETVKTHVERLAEIERRFQQVQTRYTHCMATHPGTISAADQGDITNRIATRTAHPNPGQEAEQLHEKMRITEHPTIDADFLTVAKAGGYTAATGTLETLVDNAVVRQGEHHFYHTSEDGEGFSVRVGLEGLPEVLVHMHCDKTGMMANGTNPVHWKWRKDKYNSGVSEPIPYSLRDKLFDRSKITEYARTRK